MGVAKKIPSLGGFTPVESLLKGGSSKDIFNVKNLWGDTMSIIQKPSLILNKDSLTGQGKDSNKSITTAQKQEAERDATTKRNNFLNEYGDATTFRQRKDSGLSV